ncbi:MAG: hypothetical protein CM15mP75_1450 [Flammeovirgaceae bacterium]|nr:MAG: hypothetical protein CM15mP75_1450 [Flammeovirgaceae bacterium]
MNFKISIFLISLILFIGCGDDEDSLSNDIDFFLITLVLYGIQMDFG